MTKAQDVDAIMGMVRRELVSAQAQYGAFHSAHEGFAVILEEVDELWAEVRKREKDKKALRTEAVQVAAMAVRFVLDITGLE